MANNSKSETRKTKTMLTQERLGYDIGHIDLWRLDFTQKLGAEKANDSDHETDEININIKCILDDDMRIIVTSNVSVVTKEIFFADVKATYSVIIELSAKQLDKTLSAAIVESVFYSAIWPRFYDLFAILNSQARIGEISLPRRPEINDLTLEELSLTSTAED